MGATSKIEWTDATWEPITGCTLVSEGCRNCYAAALAAGRMQHHPSMAGLAKRNAMGVAQFIGEVRFNGEWLTQPLRWHKPMTIFTCSRGDLFHADVPDEWIDQVFAVMALSPHHFFRVLTKRPERMAAYIHMLLSGKRNVGARAMEIALNRGENAIAASRIRDAVAELMVDSPLPNVGLGVSVEDQATADERIPHLLATPAVMRFVSAEPLLGPVDLTRVTHRDRKQFSWLAYDPTLNALTGRYPLLDGGPRGPHPRRLHEVIVGGESGKHARPMHPDWARSLRDQCAEAGVAFFFKQWGEWLPWEPEHEPCWEAQNGRAEDAHNLFPVDFDNQTKWDDGLSFMSSGESQAAFERVGKKAAGAKLDGREHRTVARQVTAHFAWQGVR